MPPKQQKNNKKGRKGQNRNGNAVDIQSVQQGALAPGAFNARVARDMTLKPLSLAVGSLRPPKNFLNEIHWVQERQSGTISVGGTGSITENNLAFSLNNMPDAGSYQAIFDQFFIYSVVLSISTPQLALSSATTSTGKRGLLATAIDFDSVTNVGSLSRIQEYGTCETLELVDGATVTRFVHPCTTLGTSSSISALAIGRCWLDTATCLAQPWYGFRILFSGSTLTSSEPIDYSTTILYGFRNNQ